MTRPPIDVGIFKNKIPSRNNLFARDELERAQKTGAYAFAAKARGWTVGQLDADFNGRRFRRFITDKQGRRDIARYLGTLSDEQLTNAARSGKLDLIAATGGTRVEYWIRVARHGYRAGTGWQHQAASPGVSIPLAEDGYLREVGPRLNEIIRRHNTLSNQFAKWLRRQNYKDVVQEIRAVDVEFRIGRQLCRAELKVCYPVGTTKAIREALGQLLEYNHFGGREPAHRWFIVLDEVPRQEDVEYLRTVRNRYGLPLSLGWQERDGFHIDGLDLA